MGDLWTHTGLAKFITQNTGINAGAITKKDAEQANALVRRLAEVSRETRTADLGRGHGLEFLRWAPTEPFKLHDQADRYRAFTMVDVPVSRQRWLERPSSSREVAVPELRPGARSTPTRPGSSTVGHLFTFVHRRNEVSHPADLARQMTLAGWWRSGKRGWIKATPKAPGSKPLVLPFWRVPADWEDGDDDE